MVKITMNVEGMMCGHCEAHVNDAIRSAFDIKSVSSSHRKNETVIIAAEDIDKEKLKAAVDATGYTGKQHKIRAVCRRKADFFARLKKS